mgnify:CR=1 FL=1|tara:strand:- start:89129 stop:89383 length:255 start_codon:yes stop_codon:yes gene_type:complete
MSHLKKSNDNPVPSIDYKKLAAKFIKKDNIGSSIIRCSTVYKFATYLNNLNGVETNKEQPICKKCEFNGDYIDAKCKHCNKQME